MKKCWENLYEKYPVLFENRTKSPMESCMAFGVECGEGWYDILNSICFLVDQHERNIDGQTKYKKKKNPDYVSDYHPVKFDQIKEKFGGLRVYFSGGDEYVRGLISLAEAWSYKTCENCGERGTPNKKGWIIVLCEGCRKNHDRNQEAATQ